MPEFKTITLRPMTGVFDTLSSPDEIGFGNWHVVKNAVTRSSRNRQRGGGWRRVFADDDPYNNQDLHDQLIDRLGYYGEYIAHQMGGGVQTGYGYPYFFPTQPGPDSDVYPPAVGPFCAYPYDYGGHYDDCPIFYPFMGYPYFLSQQQIPGACDTGYPAYYPFSYFYVSCAEHFYGDLIPGYPYGPQFPVYSSQFSYNQIYCGDQFFLRQGCREAITMIGEIVTSTGRKLIAGTMSRVYEYNQSSGNWRILADGLGNSGYVGEQCTCNQVRGMMDTLGVTMFYTNDFNEPMSYMLGAESSQCGLQALTPIADLVALGITRAGGVVEFKGFILFYDITEAGERQGGTVIWSDLEDGESFIEGDTSFAGRATIAVGETILNAAKLGNWLIFYTDRRIIRCSLVGGDDVFNFEDIYTDEDGSAALKYKYSLIQAGSKHLYLGGDNDVYAFTQFDTRPVMVNWITKASGMISKGIAEDDATYEPINEEACNMVTGGWNERTQEAWLSWATGDNVCPNVTLRFNLKFSAADFIDHGFTAFLSFRKELRPTVGQWLEDLGVCDRGEVVGTGPKEGELCAGGEEVTPLLYMRNPTEDASLPVHPQSLCAQLTNKTLDDFCRDCAEPSTFIMASATDFTLKQAEDDIYYRERLAFQPAPCATIEFTAVAEDEPEPEVQDMPLNSAVWSPIHQKIYACRGGYVFRFDADGVLEDSARFITPEMDDTYIDYDQATDKLWVIMKRSFGSPSDGNPSKYLVSVDPVTLAFTTYNFRNQVTNGNNWTSGETGPFRIRCDGLGIAYTLAYSDGTLAQVKQIHRWDLTTSPPSETHSFPSVQGGWWGDILLDGALIWYCSTDSFNDIGSRQASNLGSSLEYVQLDGSADRPYSCTRNPGSHMYAVQANQFILKGEVGTSPALRSVIDIGRPNATPVNIRYNGVDFMIYIPCYGDDTVVILNPADDSFVVKTGFDSPFDVVFTGSKAFAVQHGSQGLKEIV